MTLFTGRSGRAALIALVALSMQPADALSQTESAPFVVAVPDRYPAEEGAGFIVRRGDAGQQDLIVLNVALLDAASLASAVLLLKKLRASPVEAGRVQVTTVQGVAPYRQSVPRPVGEIERALSALLERPRARIGNIGQGRWLELAHDVLR